MSPLRRVLGSLRSGGQRASSAARKTRQPWTVAALEQRLMLAADCVGSATPDASPTGPPVTPTTAAVEAGPCAAEIATNTADRIEAASIVFLDSSIQDHQRLSEAVVDGSEIVLIDAGRDGLSQISEHLSQRKNVAAIHLLTHGSEGRVRIGTSELSASDVDRHADRLHGWRDALTAGADILLYGCESGKGDQGERLISAIARLTGADVAASDDVTGNSIHDQQRDWKLERHVGQIDAAVALSESRLESFKHHLGIQVRAGGATGDETIELEVDGQVVSTWTLTGTDANQNQLLDYDYAVDGISADDVRINFINDSVDPVSGIDRYVRVDLISIDGVVHQTEDPAVFSTGTWKPEDGVQPGFRESEILHANGYFQYSSAGAASDPQRGSFVVSTDLLSVAEDDVAVELTVTRVNGSDGAATVRFSTFGETAVAGEDYEPLAGTLTFGDGEFSKTLSIDLINDDTREATETFRLELLESTGANLGAPTSTSIEIVDEDVAALPEYSSFDSADDLQLNGDALLSGGELQLVDASLQQRGSVYYTTPIDVDGDTSFQASFAARFEGGQGSSGGEGLAFVIQNSPAGVLAQNIGNYPGGLDYNGVPNSIGIELDTFKNVYEQWADEITITVNGIMVTPVATVQSPIDLNNGQTRFVWVEYDGQNDLLSVFLSETDVKPQSAVLTANLSLDQIVGDQMFAGFAAATGNAFNRTVVESWFMAVDTSLAVPVQTGPGSFALESEFVSEFEDNDSVRLTVSRIGGSSGPASVDYRTFDGTAVAGEDYEFVAGTLDFADGQTTATADVTLLGDDLVEGTETFTFHLNGSIGANVATPSVATVTIVDGDTTLPTYGSFDAPDGLQLNGDAILSGGELQLVAASPQQRGSVYYTTPIDVDADTSFQASFAARFEGGQGSSGGEGLAFVIQNSPAGVLAQNIGNYSGGLNYNGVPNSIGIELDTFKNVYENWADEITITVNGIMVTPVATVQSPIDLNNGQTRYVWVEYDGQNDLLSVFLSETDVQPQFAVLTANLSLDQIVGDQMFAGFAAATGNAFNRTLVESWSMAVDTSSTDPVQTGPGSFALESEFVSEFEDNDSVRLTVSRIGGSSGPASVNFETFDDTAVAGEDYVSREGTLDFVDGQTTATVDVQLLSDDLVEGTEAFSFRLTSSVGADLLAPRTATVLIIDGDTTLPTFSSFDVADGLQLNGDAVVSGGELRLVAAAAQQRGSSYYTTPITVDSDTSFQTSFRARFDGGQGSSGGEGLAFVIQNSPAGVLAQNIGNYSGGLDYNGVPNSIGIELDTFKNSYEQWADEITITVNGIMVTPVETIQSPYDLNDGRSYHVWVDYNGQSDVLAVYVSDEPEKPTFALLKTNLELDQIVGNQFFAGFAAATGTAVNNTYVESWSLTLDTPPADPQVIPTGTLVKRDLISGLNQPLAVSWSPDGKNLYIAEKGGVVKVSREGGPVQTLIDISAKTNEYQDRGLIDFALHPDLENHPYIYLLYTVDPPQVFDNVGDPYAGEDGKGNRAGQLIRFELDASTNYTTVDPSSETIILGSASTWDNFNAFTDSTLDFAEPPAGENPDGTYLQDFINSDSRSHTVGSIAFGLDGAMFVSIGDGASFNKTDVRALRVQDIDSLSGKVLRIDPLTGQGLPDNPFYNDDPDANRSKVYQLGLRNPWRLAVDQESGRLYIGETGLSNFEEINTGEPGANFGWPYYEGGQGINRQTPTYQGLPQAQAFYASGEVAVPGFIALPHGPGSDVIVLGTVAEGLILGPQYDGDVFYNDFARGVVRHADVAADGTLLGASVFATNSEFVVDIQQGPDNYLYYVNLVQGTVGRWEIA